MVALTTPTPAGTVHVVTYNDRCDGAVEVGVGNPSTDRITVNVNTYLVDVPAKGMAWIEVPAETSTIPVRVTVTTLLPTGGADTASHTWSKPATCTTPGAVAAAVTPPATARPKLPTTGGHAGLLAGLGITTLIVGIVLLAVAGRRARTGLRLPLPRPSSAGLGFRARTFAIACRPQPGPHQQHYVGRARVPRHAAPRQGVAAGA